MSSKKSSISPPEDDESKHIASESSWPRPSAKRIHPSTSVVDTNPKRPQRPPRDVAETETRSRTAEEVDHALDRERTRADAVFTDELSGRLNPTSGSKFHAPPEASPPASKALMVVFRGKDRLGSFPIELPSMIFGRNRSLVHVPLDHPSCSGEHAALVFRSVETRGPNDRRTGKYSILPYLLDLESTNGSKVNSVSIPPAQYYELKSGDVLEFGASSRRYVLML